MSNPILSFDERAVKEELCELVRKTIVETINAMLDEEADQLVGAGPYERTAERGFTTTSGQVTLKMPKLKGMRFATAVIVDLLHYLGQIYEGLRNTERKVPTWQTPGIRGSSRRSSSGR